MTTKRTDREGLSAAPQGLHGTELDNDAAFQKGLAIFKGSSGPAPSEAVEHEREHRRLIWAGMHQAGNAVSLARDVTAHELAVQNYGVRISTIEARGMVPDPALLKSKAAAQRSLDRLTDLLAKLPKEATVNVPEELRRATRQREDHERTMSCHRTGTPAWEALVPAHMELVNRQLGLQRQLDDSAPLRKELAARAQAESKLARNSMATSLRAYITTVLVVQRDAILNTDPDRYRLYYRSIPDSIRSVWSEVQKVADLASRLHSDDSGAGSRWTWFRSLDDSLDLALQEFLGVTVLVGDATPVGEQVPRAKKAEPAVPLVRISPGEGEASEEFCE